jgi:hypothetical protein
VSRYREEPNPGPPAYMVSFSDMMTLILTFFILLVSLSREQSYGLLADGVGSFRIALESHGMNGLLGDSDRKAIFENQRRRFNLPERLDGQAAVRPEDASVMELLKAESIEALLPHDELAFPAVAAFIADSAELASSTELYVATLAESLRPARGQLLVLEGHAPLTDRLLAWRRADAVRTQLITEHGFVPDRVEARAWMTELDGAAQDAVDARLITPAISRPPKTTGDQPENQK